VIAAGNGGTDVEDYSPAGLEHPNVFSVSAIGQDDCLASFSNHGAAIDLAAPGVDILSLRAGGGMTVDSGTSMAAPHLTGLLLLDALERDDDGQKVCGDRDPFAETIAHAD
jgi:subtilisin family serine protease